MYKKNLGFSLIELLVVISILALISVAGVASFVSFNNRQVIDGAVSDVANFYILGRQRALSQVRPEQCASTDSLRGYQVVVSTSQQTYQLNGLCGNNSYVVSQKTLPPNVSFDNTSPTSVVFNVPSANTASQATVTINGYGKSNRIIIESSGAISVR